MCIVGVLIKMDQHRYIYKLLSIILVLTTGNCDSESKNLTKSCPFSKIDNDIFKISNKTISGGHLVENSKKTKDFLEKITKTNSLDDKNDDENKEIDKIIASINRIKNNITEATNNNNDETVIISPPNILVKVDTENPNKNKNQTRVFNESKQRDDVLNIDIDLDKPEDNDNSEFIKNPKAPEKKIKIDDKMSYIEILTIEPNNTNTSNSTSHNIIELLKHLLPMFNSTLTKELHNITIIERDNNKNHSFSSVKNISTIIVTYCDKENYTKADNVDQTEIETDLVTKSEDDSNTVNSEEHVNLNMDFTMEDIRPEGNLSLSEKKDILEAAEYGMQKMHELYSIMEPKLYSMGLWLEDANPARYVAAFSAPVEDVSRLTRYGYASLQAATRLKQLTGEDGLESRTEETQFPSASALRQSALMRHCPIRGIPKCPPASKRYRTHDGTCNNFKHPRWGSTMSPVQRFLAPSYSDGLQAPRKSVFGTNLPSAREISSFIHEDHNVETTSITHLLMQWGQFVDHDMTSTSQSRGFNGSVPRCCKDGGRDFVPRELMHPECFPISVPPGDPFYGPRGVRCLELVRSSPAPRDDCGLGWREQLNQVSAYIDGSPVYGSSARASDRLRLFRNGMLQYGRVQQRKPLLPPERQDELCRGGAVSTDCFKSGDGRVNEHPGLVAAHIVWLRQHNRMAQELAHLNPHWSDEKIYQETRKIIGAMIQHITYKEFLPVVLGSEVMRLFDLELLNKGYFKGYNPKINPSPASSFGSAAFRFGHSLVQPSMMRYDKFHRPMKNNVSLHNELTNPSNIWSMHAVDRLLLGMVNQAIQKRDEFITEELTNHLFQTSSFTFGMDLAAINIQRGRDHGIPAYTNWREPCGLSPVAEFEDLNRVMTPKTARKLHTLYRSVDDIDLFTGGMAERPVVGGLVGPTFACIIAQQFSHLRTGDRFWYENEGFDSSFTPAQLQQIRRITFAQVLCRTLDSVDNIQPFVFLSSENLNNERISCTDRLLNNFDLSPWVEIDSDNDISKSDNIPVPSDIVTQKTVPTKLTTTTKKPMSKLTTKRPMTRTTTRHIAKVTTKRPMTTKLKPTDISKHTTTPKLNLLNEVANPILKYANGSLVSTTSKTKHRPSIRFDLTDANETKHNDSTSTDKNLTAIKIDDKLDFKNKSVRFDDIPNNSTRTTFDQKLTSDRRFDYVDHEEATEKSVQSIIINNLSQKRPHPYKNKRPVIAVTENIDKFTYLINYVPRQTQSWRQTTRQPTKRPYKDRGDIVKVTYQTYDDTYRRPERPYYNPYYSYKEDEISDYERQKPNYYTTRDSFYSSARANDDDIVVATTRTHTDNDERDKIDNDDVLEHHYRRDIIDNYNPTTDNLHKLVTFGYVGTYKGDATAKTNEQYRDNAKDNSNSNNIGLNRKDITKPNKDVSKADHKMSEKYERNKLSTYDDSKLSTFFGYETTTKPYSNLQRSTRKNDDDFRLGENNFEKYMYVKNILQKLPDNDKTDTTAADPEDLSKIIRENYNNPGRPQYGDIQERIADKNAAFEDLETGKSASIQKLRNKAKPNPGAPKTPSVSFEIIPSENSPSLWAVYEEDDRISGDTHKMPTLQADPQAIKETPRPLAAFNFKFRRTGNM